MRGENSSYEDSGSGGTLPHKRKDTLKTVIGLSLGYVQNNIQHMCTQKKHCQKYLHQIMPRKS